MKRLTCLSVGVALLVIAPASLRAADKIPIFVRSSATSDGFTDPSKARQDSLKDVIDKVKDSKIVRSAATESEAVATVEVLSRDTKRQASILALGAMSNKSYVTVKLTAGDYSTEFSGNSGSKGALTGYGAAAKQVVRQIEDWVTVNHDRLLAGR